MNKNYALPTTLMAFLIILANANIVFSQNYWQKTYPVQITQGLGHDVQETPDGGFVFVGELDFDLGAIIHLARVLKVNASGDLLWDKTYSAGSYSGANSVRITADGGFAIGGFSYGQVYFIRTDMNGDTLFTRVFPTEAIERCYVVRLFPNGDYLLGCGIQGFEGELPFLMRLNPNGDLLWRKDILNVALSSTAITDMKIIDNEEFIYLFNDGFPHLTGADGNGETLWTTTYQVSKFDEMRGFTISGDGEYTLAGYATGIIGNNPLVTKVNTDGDLLWANFSEPLHYQSNSVEKIADGYISGISARWWQGDTTKVFLHKIGSTGNDIWKTSYLGDANPFVVYPTTDGGFIGAGTLNGSMMLIKTNESGDIMTSNHDPDAFSALDIFPNPAIEIVELIFGSGLSESSRLEWLSVDGQLLSYTVLEKGTTVYQLSLATEPSGVYIMRLVQGETVHLSKVVVQK